MMSFYPFQVKYKLTRENESIIVNCDVEDQSSFEFCLADDIHYDIIIEPDYGDTSISYKDWVGGVRWYNFMWSGVKQVLENMLNKLWRKIRWVIKKRN